MKESHGERSEGMDFNERREKLKNSFGVALCTKQKEGENRTLLDLISIAEEIGTPSVQFDFRGRTIDEILSAKGALDEYRTSHPDVVISIHGETPRLNEKTLEFKNRERILTEVELLQDISGESYTVHPPSIKLKIFRDLPTEVRERILKNYAEIFASAIKSAVDKGKQFKLAIENMPTKGDEGSWGQTTEDIAALLQNIRQALIDVGISPEVAREYLGATLDINHALHGIESTEQAEAILELWFSKLGEYLKVVHLYTPSETGKSFEDKYLMSLNLASKFSPNTHIFMESKQSPEITKNFFNHVFKNLRNR